MKIVTIELKDSGGVDIAFDDGLTHSDLAWMLQVFQADLTMYMIDKFKEKENEKCQVVNDIE
jgi:hypothetical protein